MFLTLRAVGAGFRSIGLVGIVLVLTAVPLPAQRSGSQLTQSNPETTRLDDVDQRSTLKSQGVPNTVPVGEHHRGEPGRDHLASECARIHSTQGDEAG